jgi:hypothetical protein
VFSIESNTKASSKLSKPWRCFESGTCRFSNFSVHVLVQNVFDEKHNWVIVIHRILIFVVIHVSRHHHQRARTSKMLKKCDLTHDFGLRQMVYWKCCYCTQMSFLRTQPISQKECYLTHNFLYAKRYTKNVTCHIPMWHYTKESDPSHSNVIFRIERSTSLL